MAKQSNDPLYIESLLECVRLYEATQEEEKIRLGADYDQLTATRLAEKALEKRESRIYHKPQTFLIKVRRGYKYLREQKAQAKKERDDKCKV